MNRNALYTKSLLISYRIQPCDTPHILATTQSSFHTITREFTPLSYWTFRDHEPTPPFLYEFVTSQSKDTVHTFNMVDHSSTHKFVRGPRKIQTHPPGNNNGFHPDFTKTPRSRVYLHTGSGVLYGARYQLLFSPSSTRSLYRAG